MSLHMNDTDDSGDGEGAPPRPFYSLPLASHKELFETPFSSGDGRTPESGKNYSRAVPAKETLGAVLAL